MLKVDRLEISGFKSFVDPVEVRFAGGVTAIVGPNGCGKSNLSEAITWVLGEQSAKSLRGGTMEDVIFNGSDSRKPLGMAECVLTLRTDLDIPGADEGRVTIGRRVFRGGESQYRLNGRVVRLKDVKDLLMDTGLGIRAYSVIEQGKIGMILSGKPQERRKLIEEAAGITRYKARKGIAEVKLQEATSNLLRIDDVISEVERALRSLKRQASAARRYQEKEKEYRELLEQVLLGRWAALSARLAGLKTRIEDATSREAGLAADLHRDEAALAAGRQRLDELARLMAERHQKVSEFAAIIEGRQEFLKANRQTVQEIGERAAQGRALAERREQEIAAHDDALAGLEEKRQELVGEREQAAAAVDEDERQIAAAERDLKQVQARVDGFRSQMAAATNEITAARNRAQQAQIEQEKGNFRRHRIDQEITQHAFEVKQAAEVLEMSRNKVASTEAALDAKSVEQEKVAGTLDSTMRREAEASERKRNLENQLSGARQRQRMLAELSRAHAQRRAALEKALAGAGIDAPVYLAGQAKAVEGWERSLDIYLGSLADAVILDPGESARGLATALAGRSAAILIERQQGTPESWPVVDDAAVVLSLGEALGLSEELATALPPAFLVRTAADAERLARRHPGLAFLSREGVWVEAGTFHVEGEVATPGVLERESELAALGKQVPDLENQLREAGALLDRLIAERASLAKESNRLQGEVAQLRQELAVGKARMEDAAARHRRLSTEAETLTNEQTEIAREIERVAERRQRLLEELAAAEARSAGLQEDFDRAQAELEAAKANREGLRTASAGRRGRLELLDERLESHDREMSRLRAEVERGRVQIASWREDAERLTGRRGELEQALEKAQRDLQAALENRAAAEEGVLEEQERLDVHRQEIRLLEERIGGHRERRDAVRTEVEELRISQASLKQDAEHLALTFREEFSREDQPAELPEIVSEAEDAPRVNLAELEGELARTKAALERLGPVNILAVQEHDEQETRFEFLTTQRADVATSVESLKRTIKEINEASGERFVTTFQEVNKNFGEIFSRLFRGGEAEMRLLDEEDVLESGIEILARPPGKRLQNLMLMSGGEKALTAIALLFALFRTKPSPLCILDEVDAPLDDVNTTRFVDLLEEMAGQTQFIVITHNKLSMEVASRLYGVTMEEKGVSKLVSVELEEVQPEERRATA
ncbi:MAG TPA: chromosome segregation protein SMC [Thermoanaerobaculia bacterium]|nr:chromosome segregation protein SMC [Thermoanaerobaculia bacterium]